MPRAVKTNFLISLQVLFLAVAALAAPALAENFNINAASSALDEAFLEYPDYIWPYFSCVDLSCVFVDNSNKTAFLWNPDGVGGNKPITYSTLPADLTSQKWATGKLGGRNVLSVSIDACGRDLDQVLELVCHEAFHIAGQKGWGGSGGGWRGDHYPEDWRARYIRRQIMKNLYDAYVSNDLKGANRAVFWHRMYADKYPEDRGRTRSADILEGTAEFAGMFGSSMGILGTKASSDQLVGRIRDRLKKKWASKYGNFNYSGSLAEGESYAIGALAGLYMDQMGLMGWKARASRGEPPMDVLASYFKSLPEGDDSKLMDEVKWFYEKLNDELRGLIDSYSDGARGEGRALILIPLDYADGGTWDRDGFLTYRADGYQRKFILGMKGAFTSPKTSSSVVLKGVMAEFYELPYPTGGHIGYIAVPVSSGDLKRLSAGVYTVSSDKIETSEIRASSAKDATGARWLWLN